MKTGLTLLLSLIVSMNQALADDSKQYEVSITNITRGQTFTPQFVATHDSSVSLFTSGQPASPALGILAESGDTEPLTAIALAFPDIVGHVLTIPGLLEPGKTATAEISANAGHYQLTIASMLIPTNDTFVALTGMSLPEQGSVSYLVQAYDAGTEANDQNCVNIPGPRCGGAATSAPSDSDEGYVYVSNGFHDLGDTDDAGNEILGPAVYDWRNPVARITIKRIDTD